MPGCSIARPFPLWTTPLKNTYVYECIHQRSSLFSRWAIFSQHKFNMCASVFMARQNTGTCIVIIPTLIGTVSP
jgi:hypothetical protein